MGTIYFNPKTGEFWESSKYKRKPPPGFTERLGRVNRLVVKSKVYFIKAYCPICKKYHGNFTVFTTPPLWMKKMSEFTEKYGCKIAARLVSTAFYLLGGHEKHYKMIEELYNRGMFEQWLPRLLELKPKIARRVVEMLLEGKSNEEIRAYILSESL